MNNPIGYRSPRPLDSHRGARVAWVRPTDLPALGRQAVVHRLDPDRELAAAAAASSSVEGPGL